MQVQVKQMQSHRITDGFEVEVKGQVKMALFSVNIGWLFTLNLQGQIEQVQVKLLATLAEMLNLQQTLRSPEPNLS
jgi:hypothetical protein